MNQPLKQLSLAMACIGAVCAASATWAAQPAAGASAPTTRSLPNPPIGVVTQAAGTLKSMAGTPSVELGTATIFSFGGSGHCKLTLDSGDGYSTVWEGGLPFSQPYTYSSTTMTSYESFKDYKASVTVSGNCKTMGTGPFVATVRITNSHAQSPNGPNTNNTVSLSNAAKLGLAGAAGAASAPSPAASLPMGGASVKVK